MLLTAVLLAGALASSVSPTVPASPSIQPTDMRAFIGPHRLVEIGGKRRLNLLCMGERGPTVLFDAGGSDWSVVWALVQPTIAREAVACAYDRAGLGYSDAAPGPRSPIAIAEDLHALVNAASLPKPFILVGHSLGGFNMKLYAALYPEDVAGLVLVDPAEERIWDRTRAQVVDKFGPQLAARSELLDRRFLAQLTDRYRECAANARPAGLDPLSTLYRRCSDPPRPQLGPEIAAERQKLQVSLTYQDAQASELAFSIYGDEKSDRAYPLLFRPAVFGAKPLIVLTREEAKTSDPLEESNRLQGLSIHGETARLSRRGIHRTVPGSGHYIQLDKPDIVIAAIRDALASVTPGRRKNE